MNNYDDIILYLKGLIILLESLESQDDTIKMAMMKDVEKNVGKLAVSLEKRLVN